MSKEILVNARVLTNDGTEVGKVKQVEPNAFLVNAPRQFDFWLSAEIVAAASAEKLDLAIGDSDLGAYKMDNPHDHNEFMAGVADKLKLQSVQGQTLRR